MNRTVFVLGGCRSGKSSYALGEAEKKPGSRKIFVATCSPADDEMKDRVARHQRERGPGWRTLEIPIAVPDAILEYSHQADVMLVDCLTLWVSNLLFGSRDWDTLTERITALTTAVRQAGCSLYLVSNEVGGGIVPENDLARQFRDAVGFVNQRVAACADRVVLTVAGIAVTIKPNRQEKEQ